MKKVFLFLIIAFAGFLTAAPAWAAIYNVNGCSESAVQSAVTNALSGDTINVGSGNCVWYTGVLVTKNIQIIGTGIGSTNITAGAGIPGGTTGGLIRYLPADETSTNIFRIQGFTFDTNGLAAAIVLGDNSHAPIVKVPDKVVINDNRFVNSVGGDDNAVGIWQHVSYGVVYNNIFDVAKMAIRTGLLNNEEAPWLYGRTGSNFDNIQGSANALYLEDNTFNQSTNSGFSDCVFEGVRTVYRYNTINLNVPGGGYMQLFDWHGAEYGSTGDASCFGAELYGNRINDILSDGGRLTDGRGGKSMVFNNSISSGAYTPHFWTSLGVCPPESIFAQQAIHDTYVWGNRAGYTGALQPATIGDTANCTGYPSYPLLGRDVFTDNSSPGVSCGTSLPSSCSSGQGYWLTSQSCSDLTSLTGKGATPANGTFYKCVSGSWQSYYIPYAYPHPLRTGSAPTPTPTPTSYFSPEQNIEAENGVLSSPIQISSDSSASGGKYVSTAVNDSGSASFTFNVTNPDQYYMQAKVNSNNDSGQNSFYVGLDSESAQNNNYYTYSTPVTSGYVWSNINRTGNGTATPQYDPMTWTLSVGLHTFTFYGREANTWLDQVILKKVTATKAGDLNNDGKVDITDLGILLSNWGSTAKPAADLNQDGRVDVVDLGILLSNWGQTYRPPITAETIVSLELVNSCAGVSS